MEIAFVGRPQIAFFLHLLVLFSDAIADERE